LLVYLFSSSPSILYHHHKTRYSTFQEASPCEKAIYYAAREGSCGHKAHFSEMPEKCPLCDHHTISAHYLQDFYTCFFVFLRQPEMVAQYVTRHGQIPEAPSNSSPRPFC